MPSKVAAGALVDALEQNRALTELNISLNGFSPNEKQRLNHAMAKNAHNLELAAAGGMGLADDGEVAEAVAPPAPVERKLQQCNPTWGEVQSRFP